jgi:hypothetical protein
VRDTCWVNLPHRRRPTLHCSPIYVIRFSDAQCRRAVLNDAGFSRFDVCRRNLDVTALIWPRLRAARFQTVLHRLWNHANREVAAPVREVESNVQWYVLQRRPAGPIFTSYIEKEKALQCAEELSRMRAALRATLPDNFSKNVSGGSNRVNGDNKSVRLCWIHTAMLWLRASSTRRRQLNNLARRNVSPSHHVGDAPGHLVGREDQERVGLGDVARRR